MAWNQLMFGGTEEKPWFIPFGHPMANDLNVCGGKGGNSALQYTWVEMEAGQELSKVPAEEHVAIVKRLNEIKSRIPFSYIASDHFVAHLCQKHGVDQCYTKLFDGVDLMNIPKKTMEDIGIAMKEKIMGIIGNMSDEVFNQCTDDDLIKFGIYDEITAIESMFKIIELITGQKVVSTRSNGVKEDGTKFGFHGKGKTTLYRVNPLEVFRGCLVSIASRYEQAWQSYVYDNSTHEERQQFDQFTTEFAVLIMNMIPNQTEGGTSWTVHAGSGNEKTVILQKSPLNGESSVASVGTTDEYVFDKELLLAGAGANALVSKRKGETLKKMARQADGSTEFIDTTDDERNKFLLLDGEAADQALTCVLLDTLYGRTCGDYEDGKTRYPANTPVILPGKIAIENDQPVLYTFQEVELAEEYVEQYVVQGRPTTLKLLDRNKDIAYRLGTQEDNFDKGMYADRLHSTSGTKAGSPRKCVARGVVIFGDIHDSKYDNWTIDEVFADWLAPAREFADAHQVAFEDVPLIGVFTETTNGMEPYLKPFKALFNFKGGNGNSHTIGYAGEIDVLAGYGLDDYPTVGELATVDGEDGKITFYKGELPFTIVSTDISNMPVSDIRVGQICGAIDSFPINDVRYNRPENNIGGLDLGRAESLYASIKFSPFTMRAITNGTYWDAVEKYIEASGLGEKQAEKERRTAQKIHDDALYVSRAYGSPLEYVEKQYQYFVATAGVYNKGFVAILRALDSKQDEMNELLGAKYFAYLYNDITLPAYQVRGALMLTHPAYRFIVELEMKAIMHCNNVMGYNHVHYEYAYLRQQSEQEKLDEIARSIGFNPANNYMMAELGTNFVQAHRYLGYIAQRALDADAWKEKFVKRLGKTVRVANAGVKHGGNDAESNMTDISRLGKTPINQQQRREINDDLSYTLNQARDLVFEKFGIYIELGYCGNAVSLDYEIGKILLKNGYDSLAVTPPNVFAVTYALAGVPMDGLQEFALIQPKFTEVAELVA